MGDFNINLLNYDSHSETKNFINLMVSHYLSPYILHSTRITDNLFQHDYSRFAESFFIIDFTGLSWTFLDETNLNINSKFDTLYEKVHETAIKHIPLKKVTPKQLQLRSKPWIDSHIQKLTKHWERPLHKLRKILLRNYTRNLEIELSVKIMKVKSSILIITFNPTNLT